MCATVLVTGGTGNIGSFVVSRLLDAGHDVVSYDLTNRVENLQRLDVADEVELRQGDVTDEYALLRALRETGSTHVVHLATYKTANELRTSVTSAEVNPRKAMQVNVVGSNNVFEAARVLDDQIERVVWASSTGVYGPPDAYDEWVTEDDVLLPETHYGATKQYVEQQSESYVEHFDQEIVAIRPHNVFGPNMETPQWIATLFRKAATEQPVTIPYAGDETLSICYVEDVAQAFVKATFAPNERLSHRAYNVRGELLTVSDAVDTLRRILPESNVTVPQEGSFEWSHRLDVTAAREELGYEREYDFERGAREFVDTIRRERGMQPL
ncbi:MAG: NAD-dependent epimerase/dehydratase family protein [Haloarculaceae archaeon]